jgi:hypothetical protein
MKRTVHVYAIVRVEIPDIEADTEQEAIEAAGKIVEDHNYWGYALSKLPHPSEWAEEVESFLVDTEEGEEVVSRLFCSDGTTPTEHYDESGRFVPLCTMCRQPVEA